MRSLVQSESKNQYCQALDCIAADSRLLGDTRQMFTGRGRKGAGTRRLGSQRGASICRGSGGPNERRGAFQKSRMKPGVEKCLHTLSNSAVFIRVILEPQVGGLRSLPWPGQQGFLKIF